jgi:hypothetical protein
MGYETKSIVVLGIVPVICGKTKRRFCGNLLFNYCCLLTYTENWQIYGFFDCFDLLSQIFRDKIDCESLSNKVRH